MLCWENVLTGDWQWDRPKELEQVKRNEASGSISRRHTEAKQDFPAADADNIVLECEPGCDDASIIGVRLHDDFTDGTHAIDDIARTYMFDKLKPTEVQESFEACLEACEAVRQQKLQQL